MKTFERVLSFTIALAMVLGMIPFSALPKAFAYDEEPAPNSVEYASTQTTGATEPETEEQTYPSLIPDQEQVISISRNQVFTMFQFVPEETAGYVFYSYNRHGLDPLVRLYDSRMQYITSDDDSANNDNNFRLARELTQGMTYYVEFSTCSRDAIGTYTAIVQKQCQATAMEITSGDSISGYETNGQYLYCRFLPFIATTERITWTSSDETIATVSEYGYVRLVSAGTATITATSENGLTDTCQVTVLARPQATSLYITNMAITGLPGFGQRIYYGFQPSNCVTERVTWTSSDETVATVDNYGNVSFVSAGTATITATSENGLTATSRVWVKNYQDLTPEQPVTVTITGNLSEYAKFVPAEDGNYRFYGTDLPVGKQAELSLYNAAMSYLQGGYNAIDCNLTAGQTYYIDARMSGSGSIDGAYRVNVIKLVQAESISITPDTMTSYEYFGGHLRYPEVNFFPENAVKESITWTSSDPNVVSISSIGYLIFGEAGTATVTATSASGLTDTLTVTVNAAAEIQLQETKTAFVPANEEGHVVKFTPAEDGTYRFYIECSEYNHTTVRDNAGYSSGGYYGYSKQKDCQLQGGNTYYFSIDIQNESGQGTYSLRIEKLLSATALEIVNTGALVRYQGTKVALSGKFAPENCIQENITWTSGNEAVATVDRYGNVRFISAGTVTITATSEKGLTASVEYTVKEAPVIACGEKVSLTTGVDGGECVFQFTPQENAVYRFYSLESTIDTYGYILDADLNELKQDDDSGEGNNFSMEYAMTAGQTYYLRTRPYSSNNTGSYSVSVKQLVPATSMSLDFSDTITGAIGSVYSPSVVFYPENAAVETVTWTSSDPGIVLVNDTGYIRFMAAGTATVTATSENGLTDTIEITVVEPEALTLGETKTGTLQTQSRKDVYTFTAAEDGTYRFKIECAGSVSSSLMDEPGIAIWVNSGQRISVNRAMKAGETYLLATYLMNQNESCSYTVKVEKLVPATSMTVNVGQTISNFVGSGYNLSASFAPENSIPETVTWVCSDPSVATVTSYGYLKLVGEGTATLTATSANGLTATVTVTAEEYPVLAVDIPCNVVIENNAYEYMRFVPQKSAAYRFYYTDISNSNCVPYFALVQNNRTLVTGVGSLDYYLEAGGEYIIRTNFRYGENNGSYTVHVAELVDAQSVHIDQGESVVGYRGETIRLTVSFAPELSRAETVTWSSGNTGVATVDEEGYVKLLSEGSAVITVTSENGLTDAITVTVEGHPQLLEGESREVTFQDDEDVAYFAFTPQADGYFAFYSECEDPSFDVYAILLDEEMNELAYDDDGGDEFQFRLKYWMTAGTTYVLKIDHYGVYEPTTFRVCNERLRHIQKLEILSLPLRMQYVKDQEASISPRGMRLRATWTDGAVTDLLYTSEYIDNGYIEGEPVTFDISDALNTGEVKVSCCGQTVSYTVELIDDPVDHIELVSPSSHKYIENNGGYHYNNGFRYNTTYPYDAKVRIVYKDGSSVVANVGDNVDYYPVAWSDDQYKTPWVLGSGNMTTVSYHDHTVALPVTVIKNPVESIELVSGRIVCLENYNGYETSNGFCYYYTIPDDVTVKINYTDGSSKTVNTNGKIDGYYFSFYHDQDIAPWVVGDDNYVVATYLGASTRIPVSVIPNLVDRIEILTAPTREYVYGDPAFGWSYGDEGYELYPDDMTGLSFAVHYTDGTSKVYTSADICNGNRIDGFTFYLEHEWWVEGPCDFPVTFFYLGKSAEYTVKVKASPVESIALTKNPNQTAFSSDFDPVFTGAEFTITFEDGTQKVVTLTEENMTFAYGEGGLSCYVDVDGNQLEIEGYCSNGVAYYYAYYLDKYVRLNCITCTDTKLVTSVDVSNVTATGDNMRVDLEYDDGSQETLVLDLMCSNEYYYNKMECCAMTSKGLLTYDIETMLDIEGNIIAHRVYILGQSITVNAQTVQIGDVNSDGVVDTIDRMVLNRHLAQWEGYGEDSLNLDAADINRDGVVDTIDRMVLNRHLAHWEGYEDLENIN